MEESIYQTPLPVSETPAPMPAITPTPAPVKKKVSNKQKPCKDCPDYEKEDLLREKVLAFKDKGYNDNQIAAMLMVHKEYVQSVK